MEIEQTEAAGSLSERYRALFDFAGQQAARAGQPVSLYIGAPHPSWDTDHGKNLASSQPGTPNTTRYELFCGAVNSGELQNLIERAQIKRDASRKTLVVATSATTARSLARQINDSAPDLLTADLAEIRSPKASAVRSARADLVIATPEILHRLVIPESYRFSALLESLAEVMLWDLTAMRGILGSHLHHVLRRLEAATGDAKPGLIYSATASELGEAAKFCAALLGTEPRSSDLYREEPSLIEVVMVDPASSNSGRAPATTAARIAAKAAGDGFSTLVVTKSRLSAELISNYIRDRISDTLPGAILSYRSGYLAETRAEIESEISAGAASVVVATSALGEDQGDFEVVVVVGFPGMLSRFRRDLGRIKSRRGAAILVAEADVLDSWLVTNSTELLTRPNEIAAINPWNRDVLRYQLLCACAEGAVDPDSYSRAIAAAAIAVRRELEELRTENQVVATPAGYIYTGSAMPQQSRGLRGDARRRFLFVTRSGEVLEELDEDRIPLSFYLGAIYRHRGERYLITEIDHLNARVVGEAIEEHVHTKALLESTYDFYSPLVLSEVSGGFQFGVSGISVTEAHIGHEVISDDGVVLGVINSNLPPRHLETEAFFMVLDSSADIGSAIDVLPGTLHAFEHAAIGMLGLVAICDRWDVGGISAHPCNRLVANLALGLAEPIGIVAIYDGYQGGAGIARIAFEARGALMKATSQALLSCSCPSGCPSCIVSPKCGNNNEPLSKAGAISLAGAVISQVAEGNTSGTGCFARMKT